MNRTARRDSPTRAESVLSREQPGVVKSDGVGEADGVRHRLVGVGSVSWVESFVGEVTRPVGWISESGRSP